MLLLADLATSIATSIVGFFILCGIVAGAIVYFVPTIVAFARKKVNRVPIFVLNFFLGWSLVGWVVALVWSLSQDQQQFVITQPYPRAPYPEPDGVRPDSPQEY